MATVPTVATLRTTKHCSVPKAAPGFENVVSAIGVPLSGAGGLAGAVV